MKVAIISPPWNPIPPPKYGGSETFVDGLARALVRGGHEVKLLAPEGSTCPVPTVHIPKGSQKYAFSPVCTEVGFVMSALDQVADCDVIHDNTLLGSTYAGLIDVPMITTNHAPFMGDINTIYAHSPDCRVVAISHDQASLSPLPVEVVHHGVDQDFFEYGNGEGDGNGEYLAFLGRFWSIKGIHLAIQAARTTGQRLLIACKEGDVFNQSEENFYETHVEPFLDDKIQLVGEVGGREKVDFLKNAKALVNPIMWEEPFGLVMTEALACGTPVIAMNNGAAPEIVRNGETGFICTNQDELAIAISKIDQIDRKACRMAVEDYFNIDRMAADYVKIYEKAIAERA